MIAVASTATAMYQGYWANKFEAEKKVMYHNILQHESRITEDCLKKQALQRQINDLTKQVADQEQKTSDFVSITAAIVPMTSLLMYGLVNALLRERGY